MPLYEFRCRSCDITFEERRLMAKANDPATCPEGHANAIRLLSVFASVGASSAGAPMAQPTGAGCCGGGCHL